MGFEDYSRRLLEEVGTVIVRVNPLEVECMVDTIMRARRLFLEGRGRSGMMMRAFAIRLTHLDIHCHVVGESTTPGLQPGDLLLVGSGSGETITAVTAGKSAHTAGGMLGVLTARHESTLARMADVLVLVPAPVREETDHELVATIQPMGSLFEQSLLLLLDAIVLLLKDRLRQDEQKMMARHSNLE